MGTLRLVTAPPIEPVTLADMKAHLRVTAADDDSLISVYITAARRMTESVTKRALIQQTWDWVLDRFPAHFDVPLPPLQEVVYIKYLDTADVEQVLDPTTYIVDANPDWGRVALNYARVWPWSFPVINAVWMRFIAGYPSVASPSTDDLASGVPVELTHAIKMAVSHFYENPGAVESSRSRGGFELMPLAYQALVWPYIASWV